MNIVSMRMAAIMLAWLPAIATAGDAGMLWVRSGRLTPQAQQLVQGMREAESFGLASADFAADLAVLDDPALAASDIAREAAITKAADQFIHQLHEGRVDPGAAGYEIRRRRSPVDVDAARRRIASAPDVRAALATLEPDSAQYRALTQALARYRRIPGQLARLPPLPRRRLQAGDAYVGSEALCALLAALGDGELSCAELAPGSVYDARLAGSVARFQRRHGLTADGILGARTFAALTVPIAQRIRQIELTMERWRWLPEITPPAVIVNVPQYMLYTLPRPDAPAGAAPAKIPVIVGESARRTPIFDSAIESVVVRPYWNVPSSILREEMLPLIERGGDYLRVHDLEIVRGDGDDALVLPADAAAIAMLRSGKARLRQRPGPDNALGLIKFVLPNPYSVYLHSTPERQLFARDRRALSHGCIRVSDASALAAYLLEDTPGGWDVPAIEAATCGSETFTVRLAKPVPIFILYGTVVIDAGGDVLFFDDVYGYDRKLDELLAAATSRRNPRARTGGGT